MPIFNTVDARDCDDCRKETIQSYREHYVPFLVDVVLELLRVRGERPNRCRTKKTHEVAPPHVPPENTPSRISEA
jgi:hypothetical protein